MQPFTIQLRVRRYEMDELGHVNNAVYQQYLEHVAVEHSDSLGWTIGRYREVGGVFVLRRMEIEYLRPAVAGDTLDVSTWVHAMHGPRAIRQYAIRKHGETQPIVTAEALWVWVDLATMRPARIPRDLLQIFTEQTTSTSEDAEDGNDG